MAKKTTKALVVTKASMTKAVDEATARIKTLKVRSEADFKEAGAFLKACVETKKIIAAYYKPKEDVIKADLQKVKDERATYDNALKEAEAQARADITAYQEKKEAAAAKAVERAAEKSETTGHYVAPVIKEPPKLDGVSFREVWDFAVEDMGKLVRWVMKDFANRGKYLLPNDVAIRDTMNDLKKEGEFIPGVVAAKHKTTVVR